MQNNIKRIEIITDAIYQSRLIKLLDDTGIPGYTIFKDVAGKGLKGEKDGHGLGSGFKNVYILIYCELELVKKLTDAVRPVIETFGGVCVVSDAHWIIHN